MRTRTLRPEFFEIHASAPAALLLLGLTSMADREGRLLDRPRLICSRVFPLRDEITAADVDRLLDELRAAGAVRRYETGGVQVVEVVDFVRQQRIHHREPASELPACA